MSNGGAQYEVLPTEPAGDRLSLAIELPADLLEELTQRVLERVRERPESRFLSGPALANYLGVAERTLKTFRERGMPVRRLGHSTLIYEVAEVNAWLDRGGH